MFSITFGIIGLVVTFVAANVTDNKTVWIGMLAASLFLSIWGTVIVFTSNQRWQASVYQDWTLSDQASTIDAKLSHLKDFRDALVKNELDTGYGSLIYRNQATSLSANLAILDTLITRLEGTKALGEKSLEYQQALRQITVDEYQGFDTCVFATGWKLKAGIWGWLNYSATCQDGNFAGTTSD